MVSHKRSLEASEPPVSAQKHKKKKLSTADQPNSAPAVSSLVAEEVDFPRGGGTSFTPLEVKRIRAEAIKEADDELFDDAGPSSKPSKKKKRKVEDKKKKPKDSDKNENIRIEHLNYKRIDAGMKILGQIVSIQPLALILSLPNQLFGHVPITNISSQFTQLLENADASDEERSDEDEDVSMEDKPEAPDLFELFKEGQYVRAVVTAVHASGSTDPTGVSKSRDEVTKSSRRVELSLEPGKVNAGVQKADLKPGFTLTAAVKSVEDHGYILDIGIPELSGFLSFKDTPLSPEDSKYRVGQVIEVTVTKISSNGRTCNVTADPSTFSSSCLTEVVNATSILPGTLVQGLVTAIQPGGINLQMLGFFDGTIDQLHMRHKAGEKPLSVGKKVKARVLYGFSAAPPRYALALAEHIVSQVPRQFVSDTEESTESVQQRYPVGTILESVKVVRLEQERGAFVEVEPGVEGFVHISHVSDDHVPSLSPSSPWKVNSLHRARVTGYFFFDGILQLSLKPSILSQKFLQVADVEVGAVIKGTIKKLTPTGLFVSLSGNIDGVVWPNHYADIQLKHPAKRFKAGAAIKCRVLVVDNERKRISLTAKKSLIESTLPIISSTEDVKPGLITHGTVFRVHEKYLMVEFYNNIKAIIPQKEVSETPVSNLSEAFPIGRVLKVRITTVEPDQNRILASIRQAVGDQEPAVDISVIEIGHVVDGKVKEIHQDNAVLTLKPSGVRALLSLKNLANHRSLSVAQLKVQLKVNEELDNLVVVTRNPEKGFVIVANKPKSKESLPSKSSLSLDSINIGQIVGGRVTRHARNGALVKITNQIGGILHPTDASDDYEAGVSSPAIDAIIKAAVVSVDVAKRQLTLSTRQSQLHPDKEHTVVDPEIATIDQLHEGQTVRGFIKSVADHGLFVTVGRDLDARVQIRELFDDYVKEWKERFKVNQLVKGRILAVDKESKKIEMSFRTTASTLTSSTVSVGNLQIGQKVDGTVKRIEDYGLFIQIEGSKLTGLCHKSQLSDNKDADVDLAMKNFREGDHVKAYILNIEKRKISLSLKPSHFNEEDFEAMEEDASGESDDQEFLGVMEDSGEDEDEDEDESADDASVPSGSESDDDEEAMEVDTEQILKQPSRPAKSIPGPIPTLKLTGGFQWSNIQPESPDDSDTESSDESDGEAQSKKKKKKKKEIQQDLTADMHTKTPESNADFERVLLGSPNSSYLWVQYMSFQLQLSEVDKAREIGRRAIKTINFREEQERLNVWIALLNLENVYGTDETLDAVFKEAARANDSKTIHLRLASILAESDKHDKAEEHYKKTVKKFSQSSKVWTVFAEYYIRRGDLEDARKLLPRGLQSLDKRKHLKTISKFAQLEYKLGEPERGKTLFEGIVDSHPKRWDLWSIYMDMEAGQNEIQNLRNLFERVFALKMTSHKAKSFFKKWLQLERRLGDEEGVETVKQKAVEWTQKANTS